MLLEFFSWWWAQLAPLLGPLRRGSRVPDAIVLRPETDGTLSVARRRRERETVLTTVAPGQPPAIVREAVSAGRRGEPLIVTLQGRLLLRQVTLPLAAERDLGSMLAYEIDRLTPFAAPDVIWSHRVLARDAVRGLRVELAIVPRTALASLLARLDEAGATPAALESIGPDGVTRLLPLAPRDPARAAARRRLEAVALAACIAVGIALLSLPFLRQSLALSDTEARIAALRPAVERTEALRKRIIDGGSGVGLLAAQHAQAATALRALSALTDLLPDDTWLTSFSLRKSQVSIEGHSAQAARLIALLAADPRLRNPAFIAPVVCDENGVDVFSIRAELMP